MIAWARRQVASLPREVAVALLALLAIDVVLIGVHALHVRYGLPGGGIWLISRDRGIPESFQYLKMAAIIALLLMSHRRHRSAIYLAWAATFGYFLVDDSAEVHETLGDLVADGAGFDQPLGLEGRDVGQVLVSASIGVVLLVAIGVATSRDRSPARPLTIRLLPLLVALGFFGVVVDVIDAIDVLGLVEDGGEMVTMTVAVAVVVDHWRRVGRSLDAHQSGISTSVTGDSTQPA
ncbi:MAG: hypothetical protein AAGA93_25815 [Actinomycetota bacterium]